jgi:hypothetical protein
MSKKTPDVDQYDLFEPNPDRGRVAAVPVPDRPTEPYAHLFAPYPNDPYDRLFELVAGAVVTKDAVRRAMMEGMHFTDIDMVAALQRLRRWARARGGGELKSCSAKPPSGGAKVPCIAGLRLRRGEGAAKK